LKYARGITLIIVLLDSPTQTVARTAAMQHVLEDGLAGKIQLHGDSQAPIWHILISYFGDL
jgi:hypothetical protein